MVLRGVASSRQPSPCALSSSRKAYLGNRVRVDGSLSGHHASWADVFGSRVLGWHSGSLPASWRATRSLRTGRLRRHVQPCPCDAVDKNLAIKAYAVLHRRRFAYSSSTSREEK